MKTVVIACKTIVDELNAALIETGVNYPVVWLESGLHNNVEKLRESLQNALNSIQAERVLFGFGSCGNAIVGISSRSAELVIPRVADCISLLVGSDESRTRISEQYAAYFLTEGWLRGERNIWEEHRQMTAKYGEETALEIIEMIYGHYRTLALLDLGITPIEQMIESTDIIAKTLHLQQKVIPASISYLAETLVGPWPDERFLVIPAGNVVRVKDLL